MSHDLFSFFDPDEEIEVTHRNLPHWWQPGKMYFITFRTDDSLPRAVLDAWYDERNAWLKRHGIETDGCSAAQRRPKVANRSATRPAAERRATLRESLSKLSIQERREFYRTFSQKLHRLLDRCYGACVLKRPELAAIVGDSLRHFDGDRYEMGDFVVMPNHVHMLVQFNGTVKMKQQCDSWKHFTAVQINRALGQTGHFWQGESFDHLVRSPEQFDALRRYIAENPRKARLREGEYLHYVRTK